MLSVHSPGYTGMERLGVPTRSSMTSRPNQSGSAKSSSITKHHQNHQFDSNHHFSNISCPPHISLSDGEWGPDKDFQCRNPSQVLYIFGSEDNLSFVLHFSH